MLLIKIIEMTKKYDNKVILDKINMEIKTGESIAIVGRNGMGKSTLLRIIAGLIRVNSGKVEYLKKIKFSYIPENFSKLDITVHDYLSSMAEIDMIKESDFRLKIEELYNLFGLESMIDVKMKNLSKGSLQKVAALQALVVKPDVLILDEPLSGQDVQSQENFIKIVKGLISEGITVIMSCHEERLINELSSKVFKIENKKIVEVTDYKFNKNKIQYAKMIFENREVKEGLKEYIAQYGELSINNNGLGISVEKSKANEILLEMISNGYTLFNYKIEEDLKC